jgi:superfamily II DNA or RNA helicase
MTLKTYLSSRGYAIDMVGNESQIEVLRKLLTAKPRVHPDMPNAEDIKAFPVYRESTKKFYMPKAFGLEKFGKPTVNTLHKGNDAALIFKGSLRAEQEEPVQLFMESCADPSRGGGIISVGCGFGKTLMGLNIACRLKTKTLVICHKEFLMNQWRERIEEFIPTARVGRIKQNKVDVENKDIVLASLQSLAMKDYPDSIFQEFGFVILDECHHTSAEVFSRALHKITSPYILGLSATLDRKDGLRKVFEWFIGKPVFVLKKRLESDLIVKIVPFYDPHPDYGRERFMYNGKLNVAQMINAITDFRPRNELIIKTLKEVLDKEPNRKVLILSDRRKHLQTLECMIKEQGLGTIGYYVGGMKEADLKASEGQKILLGTFALASEGMDVPALNTLILASPISAIEQPIGRIQRQKAHERQCIPLVIDVWDQFSLFKNQGFRRITFYKKNGYSFAKNKSNKDGEDDDDSDDEDKGGGACDVVEVVPLRRKYEFDDDE